MNELKVCKGYIITTDKRAYVFASREAATQAVNALLSSSGEDIPEPLYTIEL